MSTKNQTAEKWSHDDIRTLDAIVDNCTKAKKVSKAKENLAWVQNDKKLLAQALSNDGLLVEDEQTGEQRLIRFSCRYQWNASKVTPSADEE